MIQQTLNAMRLLALVLLAAMSAQVTWPRPASMSFVATQGSTSNTRSGDGFSIGNTGLRIAGFIQGDRLFGWYGTTPVFPI